MSTSSFSLLGALRQSMVLAVVAGSAAAVAGAQTGVQSGVEGAQTTAQQPQFSFAMPMSHLDAEPQFSSSSDSSNSVDAGSTATQMNLASLEKNLAVPGIDAQYGRRRYGATRYRGSNTNGDGSEKYTAYAGVGLTLPVGDLHNYDTASWGFQVGAGRNFNKNFGVNLEFGWDEFGVNGNVLNNQGIIEDPYDEYQLQGNTDGYSHIWSLSIQPVYNFKTSDTWGAYVTGGVGFYHKITTFTTPETVEGYDYFGYPEEFTANEPYDSYTSNAPGFDGGVGITYKFSRFANERFYAEARYVYVDNSQKPGIDQTNYNNYAAGGYDYPTTNLYPANSRTSSYIPIKFGIRF